MIVMVTGASSGIGAAVARRFAKGGHRLILTARRQERLEALKKEIGNQTSLFPLDLRSWKGVEEMAKKIEKDNGPIDVLINNAGLGFGLEPAHLANLDEWETCIDVNIKALLYCTRAILPSMVERNQGHIINLGSVAGTYPYPGGNVYGATKAFVHQFSLNLRADLLGKNVRVSCIEPGLVSGTEFSEVRFRGDLKKARAVYEKTQALQPEDIAETIYFCATLPSHVNVNILELMPVLQASAPLAVYRES
ncbi:MAG: SDR family NAD(P)-dependent oxidoreductase [Anaerolineae bacterium]